MAVESNAACWIPACAGMTEIRNHVKCHEALETLSYFDAADLPLIAYSFDRSRRKIMPSLIAGVA
jgi:hypothetical protein